MIRYIFITTFCYCMSHAHAQVQFTQVSNDILPGHNYGGVAMAFADIDGDRHDDLVLTESGNELSIYCYRGRNIKYEKSYSTNMTSTWSLSIGNVTGNEFSDIIAVNSNSVMLIKQTSKLVFEKSLIYTPDWLPQSSNLVDIDSDGDLDLFICNDEGNNIILTNDGSGNFVEDDIIDFTTNPQSDNSGNYSSIWTDIDSDGDKDLYIAKCRAGVTSFSDPRRINALYINNGDGSFTESANSWGLDDAYQSWSTDSGDVDNDGDLDILVTNHDGPHHLYINQGSTFEKFDYGDPLISFAFQGVFEDMDNNGWLDLVITDGKYNYVMYNEAMVFSRKVYQNGGAKPNSAIIADLNNDGFMDILGSYPGGRFVGSSSNISNDRIWINNGNDNKFINIKLEGDQVEGAIIELQGSFGIMKRELKNGISYGQHIGTTAHFGLGQVSEIHTLIVTWADGTIQTIEGNLLELNNTYILGRDGCLSKIENVMVEEESLLLCHGDSIRITSEKNNEVNWFPIEIQSQNLEISNLGSYSYTYIDSLGCKHSSDFLNPISEDRFYAYPLGYEPDHVIALCEGEEYELMAQEGSSYLWSTGETTQNISVSDVGVYNVEIETDCGNIIVSEEVEIIKTDIPEQLLQGDIVNLGEIATIESDQDSTYWYETNSSYVPLGKGKLLESEPMFEPRYFFAQIENKNFLSNLNVGIKNGPDTLAFSGDHINSGLVFEVSNTIIIQSVKVETDLPGKRRILILKGDEEVFSKDFDIGMGVNMLVLNKRLDEGNYVMTTDSQTNMLELGHEGPRLSRVQDIETVQYPYKLGKDLIINNSLNGSNRYYYFFDWNVDYNYQTCIGVRDSVYVEVRPLSNDNQDNHSLSMTPNPVKNLVEVSLHGTIIRTINLYSLQSELLKHQNNINSSYCSLELSCLGSGIYVIEIIDDYGRTHRDKIMVVK